ncbi:hypothetical protein [Streptomyces sp. N50]|uniref:hypothetical protein n=1 Tax=Streptomyces sp. N50 TaxID=3081765 RepID=UPI002962318E|nr:hypothetical protein [Streptomyces sp. N50]WOX12254.1 hypothetical protein R2B38_27000 [Streptomyces sp. N50]
MKRPHYATSVALIIAFSALIVACGRNGNSEPNAADSSSASIYRGMRAEPSGEKLLTAMKDVADSGEGFTLKDATSLGRYVYHGQVGEYIACFRKGVPKLQAVEIYAVPKAESCPERLGMRVQASKLSSLVGQKLDASLLAVLVAGYYPDHVKVFKADAPESQVANPKSLASWQVCVQEPRAGTEYVASAKVRLYVAEKCP